MYAVSGEAIFDLNQTGLDFLNEVRQVFFDKRSVWFIMTYPECKIIVQGVGDGTFYLYRTPVKFDFDFENAMKYNTWSTDPEGVICELYDTRCHVPLRERLEALMKQY